MFALDIAKDLQAYEIEYHVLREEMISTPHRSDTNVVTKLENANHSLKKQNLELLEKLQIAHSHNRSLNVQVFLSSCIMYSLEWLVLPLLQCVDATIPEYHNFQIRKLQLANSELKKHVRTVESEKAVLVTCLSRVQDTVPTHLLQEANIRLPSSIQAPSFTSTPMHNFIGTYARM